MVEDRGELCKIRRGKTVEKEREKKQKCFELFEVDTVVEYKKCRKKEIKSSKLIGEKTWSE